MTDQRFDIQEFITVLSEIPKSDLLVHLTDSNNRIYQIENSIDATISLPINQVLARILKETKQFQKDADINTLALTYGTISWSEKGQTYCSPLFLIPCQWKQVKTAEHIQMHALLDHVSLNPVVSKRLMEWTDAVFEMPIEGDYAECFDTFCNFTQANELPLELNSTIYLGNFHYHRFHLLRELEGIVNAENESILIQSLLGNEITISEKISLTKQLLTPADIDQVAVFDAVENGNVVIQGPPGTGKSQVLTNLLGKLLAAEKQVLVVSEKKAALTVLENQLKKHGLAHFSMLVHNQLRSRDFIQQLHQSWTFLEQQVQTDVSIAQTAQQRISALQLLIDRLNAPDTIGGISFSKYLSLVAETPWNKPLIQSDILSLDNWLSIKPTIKTIQDKIGDLSLLSGFKPAFFQAFSGDKIVQESELLIAQLATTFQATSYVAVLSLYEAIGRCQLVENEAYKAYATLVNKPREWKRFEQQFALYVQLDNSIKHHEKELTIWRVLPTEAQVESWKKSTGFFNNRRKNSAIKRLLVDQSVDVTIALQQIASYLAVKQQKTTFDAYFESLGLTGDITALQIGYAYAKSLRKETSSVIQEIAAWPAEKRQLLLANAGTINQLVSLIHRFFTLEPATDLCQFIASKKQELIQLVPVWNDLNQLPIAFFGLVHQANDWQGIQSTILAANWSIATHRFPELVQFNGQKLADLLQQIIVDQDREMSDFGQRIIAQQRKKFQEYEALLRKPAQQCSAEEKTRKAQLKKGKARLVKEFAKTRTHASIRELLASDAQVWIDLLCPIWMSSPNQIADHFPLVPSLFDVVLFDEASQLTLPNALGALFRSNRAVIAGDTQQMSPTSFFGRNWDGHDLLHQARFYYKNCSLKHHYRSADPALIAFSNRHFYDNQLLTYPSPTNIQAVNYHFIENALFVERKNTKEAQEVANKLAQLDWSKRIGIIAFSEQQLTEIWANCSVTIQDKINQGIDNNSVFFKSLENVQGDEAEIVVLSLGYARDENNVFALRFGPLNHTNGFKRLNVLLTRAQTQLHFFSSVLASDFKLSTNESVNLLRRLLMDLEAFAPSDEVILPHGITPKKIVENQLFLPQIFTTIQEAHELVTFHRVMKSRGWELNYS
jgi:hypothetical protein